MDTKDSMDTKELIKQATQEWQRVFHAEDSLIWEASLPDKVWRVIKEVLERRMDSG